MGRLCEERVGGGAEGAGSALCHTNGSQAPGQCQGQGGAERK